jgi:hypothetical protein
VANEEKGEIMMKKPRRKSRWVFGDVLRQVPTNIPTLSVFFHWIHDALSTREIHHDAFHSPAQFLDRTMQDPARERGGPPPPVRVGLNPIH